jgi:peptidoglycan/xylan/chitin deacetylase (PgdA/CDA1 family)
MKQLHRVTALTFDIDWAPDWMIEEVALILIEHNVKATWFVTHASPAIDKLRQMPELFELGIHPNCLPGSTHGNTEDEVLSHIKEIVPEAISMRTHGLYQSSNFLMKAARNYGIEIDVSILLYNTPYIIPHQINWGGGTILRIPFFWEDDLEMYQANPIWDLSDTKYARSGLKIVNFHPIHIVLNTPRFDFYKTLKEKTPIKAWSPELIKKYRRIGNGPRTLFESLVNASKGGGYRIKDLMTECKGKL